MFDPVRPEDEVLSPDMLIQPNGAAKDELILERRTHQESPSVMRNPALPTASQIRIILLNQPDDPPNSRLPMWLHELIGWGVFLFLLAAFLSLQINLSHLFNGAGSQFLIILTVLAEIALLWGWDQFWY